MQIRQSPRVFHGINLSSRPLFSERRGQSLLEQIGQTISWPHCVPRLIEITSRQQQTRRTLLDWRETHPGQETAADRRQGSRVP